MQVIINSDKHVEVKQTTTDQWKSDIVDSLSRFSDWITRVEVHLNDQNSQHKGGSDDIRCLMEARPSGRQPVTIEVRSATARQAIQEGTDALERRLDTLLDKTRTEQRKGQ